MCMISILSELLVMLHVTQDLSLHWQSNIMYNDLAFFLGEFVQKTHNICKGRPNYKQSIPKI